MSIRFDRRKHVIPEIFFFIIRWIPCFSVELYDDKIKLISLLYILSNVWKVVCWLFFMCVCLLLFLIFSLSFFSMVQYTWFMFFNTSLSYLFKSLIIVRCFINFSSITSNKVQIYYTYNELSQFKPNHYICPLTEIRKIIQQSIVQKVI